MHKQIPWVSENVFLFYGSTLILVLSINGKALTCDKLCILPEVGENEVAKYVEASKQEYTYLQRTEGNTKTGFYTT